MGRFTRLRHLWYNKVYKYCSLTSEANTVRRVANLYWRLDTMDTLSPHAREDNTPEKTCVGPCGRTLPATAEFFHRDKNHKYGFASLCKECRNQSRRKTQPVEPS